jgi:glutamyl-tRNA synthetase
MVDNSKTIRTRFAPSPTGFVHVGNFRTALFAFLFARHNGGVNVLRVEDTDQNRLVAGAVENLLAVMEKLGVTFDEGYFGKNGEKGEYGPYLQSARLDIYKQYADELIANGAAYYCFCSEERLEEVRKEQIALKKPAMYDRHCRSLTDDERAAQLESGQPRVVRQAIPVHGSTTYQDLVYGTITIDHSILDDQILLKSDGFPTYHFAVVVDDHLMEITHVIRGEEYLSSTPKHVLLYDALGWQMPAFAHMPLILNPDKTKLSKRQGDVDVESFLKQGYLPDALVNFVALLGWNPKTEQEIFSMEQLIAQFDLAKVNKSGAVFDLAKLDWLNNHYIKQLPDEKLADLCKPYLAGMGPVSEEYLLAIISLEKERLKKLSDIVLQTEYFFKAPQYEPQLLVWRKSDAAKTKQVLALLRDFVNVTPDETLCSISKFEESLKAFIAEHELDNGTVLWPLRVAMTGREKSPTPFEVTATIAQGLGRAEVLARLETAHSLL